MKYRKQKPQKPEVIEATQWFKNGDHPEDKIPPYSGTTPPVEREEGKVVKFYKHFQIPGTTRCTLCRSMFFEHGWIGTLEGGHFVCPGDWIITGVSGDYYPCKPDIFAATYAAEKPINQPSKPPEISRPEMIANLREFANQILSPESKGKKLFNAIADELEKSTAHPDEIPQSDREPDRKDLITEHKQLLKAAHWLFERLPKGEWDFPPEVLEFIATAE